jgi:hypothetical protein
MKGISYKPLWIGLTMVITTHCYSADLVGKWTGKMSLDGSAIKKQLQVKSAKLTGEKKKAVENRLKMIEQSIQIVDKTKIRMDVKKGGVAFIEFNRNGKAEPEWCKWKVKGKQLVLSGFTGGGDTMMNLEGSIADSGKTLIFDMSFVIQQQMAHQGLKSSSKPKMTLTFKKS